MAADATGMANPDPSGSLSYKDPSRVATAIQGFFGLFAVAAVATWKIPEVWSPVATSGVALLLLMWTQSKAWSPASKDLAVHAAVQQVKDDINALSLPAPALLAPPPAPEEPPPGE